MSTLQEMLTFGGGSFVRAEQICLDFITKGNSDLYLDLALLLHAQGKIIGAKQAGAEYIKLFPDCPRGKLAESWFKFYDGDLNAAWDHFDFSRLVGTLKKTFPFDKPRWTGADVNGKDILLIGEGGFGDQCLGLRSASFLSNKGARVITSCSKGLMNLFSKAKGVYGVIEIDNEDHVPFDIWIPTFSSFRHCGLTWDTLYPGQYIQPIGNGVLWERIIPKSNIPNIGLRWRGNPKYEHEQFRVFPVELMFNAVKDIKANFYSLQKDDHTTEASKN